MLARVLERVAPRRRFCVEFGAGDGLRNSNTARLLRESGWRGVMIEAADYRFQLRAHWGGDEPVQASSRRGCSPTRSSASSKRPASGRPRPPLHRHRRQRLLGVARHRALPPAGGGGRVQPLLRAAEALGDEVRPRARVGREHVLRREPGVARPPRARQGLRAPLLRPPGQQRLLRRALALPALRRRGQQPAGALPPGDVQRCTSSAATPSSPATPTATAPARTVLARQQSGRSPRCARRAPRGRRSAGSGRRRGAPRRGRAAGGAGGNTEKASWPGGAAPSGPRGRGRAGIGRAAISAGVGAWSGVALRRRSCTTGRRIISRTPPASSGANEAGGGGGARGRRRPRGWS